MKVADRDPGLDTLLDLHGEALFVDEAGHWVEVRGNRELLSVIAREKPGSLTELAEFAGRNKSNLSRTLKTMARYGLVELKVGRRGRLIPRVPYERVTLDVLLTSTPGPPPRRSVPVPSRGTQAPRP